MNAPSRLRSWNGFVVTFVLILAGCTMTLPPSASTPMVFSCRIFEEPFWKEFRFGIDSPEEVASVVANLRRIDKSQIRFIPQAENDLRVEWTVDNNQYSALFRKERRLVKIDVRWNQARPTLEEILGCLGSPEQYQAVYQQVPHDFQLEVSIWYPQKGLVVSGYSFHRQTQPPAVHLGYSMQSFIVVASDDLTQMVSNVYTAGNQPGIQAYALRLLKPWPGSAEQITVDSCLADPELCRSDRP